MAQIFLHVAERFDEFAMKLRNYLQKMIKISLIDFDLQDEN